MTPEVGPRAGRFCSEVEQMLISSSCLLQSQFLLSLQAISIMVHFYMGTKGPDNVSASCLQVT